MKKLNECMRAASVSNYKPGSLATNKIAQKNIINYEEAS